MVKIWTQVNRILERIYTEDRILNQTTLVCTGILYNYYHSLPSNLELCIWVSSTPPHGCSFNFHNNPVERYILGWLFLSKFHGSRNFNLTLTTRHSGCELNQGQGYVPSFILMVPTFSIKTELLLFCFVLNQVEAIEKYGMLRPLAFNGHLFSD